MSQNAENAQQESTQSDNQALSREEASAVFDERYN